jgi:hypothetical protein
VAEAIETSMAKRRPELSDQLEAGSEEVEASVRKFNMASATLACDVFLRSFSKTRDKALGNIYNFGFRSQLENLVGGFLTRTHKSEPKTDALTD